jgi:hypothetical protein
MILLDATEKYSVPNVLPLRDLNWFGRLIRKDGSSIEVGLIPDAASKEITFLTYNLNPDGTTIQGKIRNQYFDHEALDFRVKNVETNKDTYLETLENVNNSIEINDYVRDNDLDISKPIVETYSFKDAKSVEIINGKIYIAPLLFLTERENPFKQEKREYPVDFGYPKQNRYNVSIDIPQGYTIESMPKAMNLVTGENMGTFKYAIGNTGNKIQITITEDINTAIISSEYYDVIKEFFQKIIDQSNEKIVLVKA